MAYMVKRYYWIILVVLPCLMGLETCGIKTFLGGKEGDYAPTEPCAERIPSPTPLAIMTPFRPTPKGTPIIIAGVTPTPNSVPTLSIEPTPTWAPMLIVRVDNTDALCTTGIPCGILPAPPCCLFQEGIDTAYSAGINIVRVLDGTYDTNENPGGVSFAVNGTQDLTIEAGPALVTLRTLPYTTALRVTSPATNMISSFRIEGEFDEPAVEVNAPGGNMTFVGNTFVGNSYTSAVEVYAAGSVTFGNNTFDGGTGLGSLGICLAVANGNVTINSNAFNYNFTGTFPMGSTIACTGGSLMTDGANTQNVAELERTCPTVACNPFNPPAYSCSSPPNF